MADDTSPFETGDLEDLRFESPDHALTAACPTDGEVSPNAKVFVEHGFWRYDVTSGLFSWADSRFPGGRPISLEADQADIWEAIHPADRAGFQAFILRAASTGEACAQALRMKSRDGSWRMISNHAAAQTDSAGVVTAVHGVVMDVTELEICRTLAEEGNDIIIRTDSVGRITYISPSVEKVAGFTPLELTGQLIADILDEDAARAVGIAFVAALANPGGGQRPVQYKARHKDGRTIWLESRIIPVIDHATGQPLGATDVARDVTRHRTAEANLERANILLNVIMDASPSGIVMVDNDGRVTSFNQTFADMWNLSPETLERADSTPGARRSRRHPE